MQEIREIKLATDMELLESFLMVDPIQFLPLISCLKGQRFPRAYAGISGGSMRTLATMKENGCGVTIWPGDAGFVEPILEKWGPSRANISVGVKHLHNVLNVYKPIRVFDEVLVMFVDKGHFLFKPRHEAERLSGEELPKPWTKDFKGIAYGILAEGEAISCGTVSDIVKGVGSCGAAMWTSSQYRNQGYATSALSYAVQDALDLVPIVTYPVEYDNIPAIRVLEKLGFRLHSAFLYTEVERMQIC